MDPDCNGDGHADIAVWRPSSGYWYIKYFTGAEDRILWGDPGDVPVPAAWEQTFADVTTCYIWSYDGKLLAEYDQNDTCLRDYIYFGGRLLCEYLPQDNKYYYHTSDQVNSVR